MKSKWVSSIEEVLDYARDNDGQCVVATMWKKSKGDTRIKVFDSPESFGSEDVLSWDWFFCEDYEDEPYDIKFD